MKIACIVMYASILTLFSDMSNFESFFLNYLENEELPTFFWFKLKILMSHESQMNGNLVRWGHKIEITKKFGTSFAKSKWLGRVLAVGFFYIVAVKCFIFMRNWGFKPSPTEDNFKPPVSNDCLINYVPDFELRTKYWVLLRLMLIDSFTKENMRDVTNLSNFGGKNYEPIGIRARRKIHSICGCL